VSAGLVPTWVRLARERHDADVAEWEAGWWDRKEEREPAQQEARVAAHERRLRPLKRAFARMRSECRARTRQDVRRSKSEDRLAEALARTGLAFDRQQEVENDFDEGYEYVADFAYYVPGVGFRLALEVDGEFKFDDDELMDRLDDRDDWFKMTGWHVLRFTSAECFYFPHHVAAFVVDHIREQVEAHAEELDRRFGPEWRDL
jgi:very-short-patch-repair endonuclease